MRKLLIRVPSQSCIEFVAAGEPAANDTIISIYIPKSSIADVDSTKHIILQGLDVILGSMCAKLNDKLKYKPENKRLRGRRTLAKERLYKAINQEIRKIYPNFNVGTNTGCHYGPSDRWTHPYRHWLFTASDTVVDRRLGKRATPEQPT